MYGLICGIWFDEKVLLTEEYLYEWGLPWKILFMWGHVKNMMTTYLIGFCLMECGPIAAGLSFNGYDKESG